MPVVAVYEVSEPGIYDVVLGSRFRVNLLTVFAVSLTTGGGITTADFLVARKPVGVSLKYDASVTPVVESLSPNNGTARGGTNVTIVTSHLESTSLDMYEVSTIGHL